MAAKSGSRGKIQDWYCQGLTGCSARIRSTDDTEIGRGQARPVSSAASSGPVHRDSGTPVAAGSWQASATTAARSASLIRRGRPDRGRSLSPSRPRAANRPRHLRTVSTLIPQVRGDPRVVPAARGSQHDLRPQPVPVRRLRAPDAFLQGRALAGGQRDRHRAKQRHGSSGQITAM